jgi:Spy/CpxP family protein refolding chaperone
MHRSKSLVVLSVVVLGAALVAAQQQSSSSSGQSSSGSAQQQQTTTPRRGSNRLTQPWNKLTDLSDDVKTKIIAIHRKSVEEVNAIRAREREDILALLTEAQKKEVTDIEAQARVRRGSTTRPAAGAAGN